GMPVRGAASEKKPRLSYDSCERAESFSWLVKLARSMVHDPVPSAATARRYRRQFKQIMQQTLDVAIRAELERRWAQNVEQMPGLAIASGRPRENVSGLVLYVLTAVVAQVLDDAAAIDADKRAAHFERAGDLPRA